MRATLLFLPIAALAACGDLSSGAGSDDAATGPSVTRSFPAGRFDSVALRGPDDVIVRSGPTPSVSATGDATVIAHLKIELVGSELRIGRDPTSWSSGNRHATVTVTVPSLRAATLAGSGDMTVDRLAAPSIGATVSGSGDLGIAAAQADSADIAVSGSGELTIAGRSNQISVSITGSGDVHADRLESDTAAVSSVGSGGVSAMARTSADVSLFGSGDVTIRGGAHCAVTRMGSGDVRCGDDTNMVSRDRM